MARTIIGVNDPKAVKRFSGMLAVDASHKSYFGPRFEARGADAEVPIQILTDLETDAGEQITYDLMAELTMAPVEGEDNLEGNEERQKFYTDQIYVDQARCGVNTGGRMTRKRTLHDLRARAKQQQSSWWARVQDELKFIYLTGKRGINPNFVFPLGYAGRAGNPLAPSDAAHTIYGGDATDYSNLDANDKFSLSLIDRAKTRADSQGGGATGVTVLQPCKIDGEEHFVCVMNTFQEDDLRKEVGGAGWLDIQKALATAEGRKSPLCKGGLGMYRGVILHSHRNAIRANDAGAGANVEVAHALFMGAQAGVAAYGSPGTNLRYDWHEETRDNGDKVVITTSSIFGTKKVRFKNDAGDEQDFGVFNLPTAAASR